MKNSKSLSLFLCWAMISLISLAAIPALAEEFAGLETHAFLSQGYIKSTGNDYLAKSKNTGSFNFTEVGINFTKKLSDELRFGVQLFTRTLGPTGNFTTKFDWLYLDYHWSDHLGFRFGRVKVPFGLYNDSSDIDSARASVLLPQSVYPIQNRDFLLAQSGMELYGYSGSGPAGALDYRFYAGTIFLGLTNTPGSVLQVRDLSVPFIAGGRILWEAPWDGLRIGGSVQTLRLDTGLVFGTGSNVVTAQVPALLWVGSIEYAKHDWLLSAEYSRWYVKATHSSNQALFPETSVTSERGYGMISYRVTPWLQPSTYYSITHPTVRNRSGRQNHQHDLAATLRFDINRFWLVKLEGHYMLGTAGLTPTLNDDTPNASAEERWGVFLVKTTAYF